LYNGDYDTEARQAVIAGDLRPTGFCPRNGWHTVTVPLQHFAQIVTGRPGEVFLRKSFISKPDLETMVILENF
jgi:hypothetical protein